MFPNGIEFNLFVEFYNKIAQNAVKFVCIKQKAARTNYQFH